MSTDPRVTETLRLVVAFREAVTAAERAPTRGPLAMDASAAMDEAWGALEARIVSMAAEIARLTAELEKARKDAGPIAEVVDNAHYHDQWRLQIHGITVAGDTGADARRTFQRLAGQINMAAAMTKEKLP